MLVRARKKPVEIDAIQWDGSNVDDVLGFILPIGQARRDINDMHTIIIETLEGSRKVNQNDWIIRGVKGEFYPCKPDIFEATYDIVGSTNG